MNHVAQVMAEDNRSLTITTLRSVFILSNWARMVCFTTLIFLLNKGVWRSTSTMGLLTIIKEGNELSKDISICSTLGKTTISITKRGKSSFWSQFRRLIRLSLPTSIWGMGVELSVRPRTSLTMRIAMDQSTKRGKPLATSPSKTKRYGVPNRVEFTVWVIAISILVIFS